MPTVRTEGNIFRLLEAQIELLRICLFHVLSQHIVIIGLSKFLFLVIWNSEVKPPALFTFIHYLILLTFNHRISILFLFIKCFYFLIIFKIISCLSLQFLITRNIFPYRSLLMQLIKINLKTNLLILLLSFCSLAIYLNINLILLFRGIRDL